jgi:hypothetical protein
VMQIRVNFLSRMRAACDVSGELSAIVNLIEVRYLNLISPTLHLNFLTLQALIAHKNKATQRTITQQSVI